MAGERGRLTDLQIRHWVRAGVPMAKADGGGLTFTLSAGGATGWILRYSHGGRRRELTIGRYPDISLVDARGIATIKRAEIMQGRNPAADKQKAKATAAKDWTVRELVKDYRAEKLVSLAHSTQVSYGRHLKRVEKKLGSMAFACGSGFQLGREQVAVAIQPGLLGSHIGAAFWTAEGEPAIVHLAFHKLLAQARLPTEPNHWLLCPVPIPELRASQVVSIFRALISKHQCGIVYGQSIDYGVSLFAGRGAIRADGAYAPQPGFDGFTCATFVAEMFRVGNVGLANLNKWPTSERNRIWGRAIVCMLRTWRAATPEHIAKVEASNTGFRLLPEELAAAAESYAGKALEQSAIAARAASLRLEIQERYQPLQKEREPNGSMHRRLHGGVE